MAEEDKMETAGASCIESREAFLEVSKTAFGKEEVDSQRIRIRPFMSHPAVVSVKAGATINLGNYESARVDVMLSFPCYPEEIEAIYEKVKEWVDDRMAKEYATMNEYRNKKQGG